MARLVALTTSTWTGSRDFTKREVCEVGASVRTRTMVRDATSGDERRDVQVEENLEAWVS